MARNGRDLHSLGLQFGFSVKSETAEYRNLQKLGEGGTAETYLMLATAGNQRGQLFALKFFRRLSKPAWRDNFLREVQFLKECSHPSVMRVFVAEYLPSTLATALRMNPGMMAKMAYAIQLLSALEYLSRPDISVIHRDIKPTNLFIKGGSCIVGDFGLMKRLELEDKDDLQRIKASFGPRMPRGYRTPELVEYFKGGPRPTEKSDVFQLGIVLAEMFSGKNPQKWSNNFKDRVETNDFSIDGGMGPPIKKLIIPMLDPDVGKRPTASKALDQWQELFLYAARRSHALEGRVV
jgi:serine/threonine protein kinase